MRNSKLFIISTFMLFSLVLSANDLPNTEKDKVKKEHSITESITLLLNNHSLILDKETVVEVSFLINNKKEIVVLSVNTLDKDIEAFIKSRLNYSETDVKDIEINRPYSLAVKFLKTRL